MVANRSHALRPRFNQLSTSQRATHTYVIGQPGTGKSRAIESWVLQDIAAGRGVGVIDPHGDLFRNLLYRIARMPETWERVVIIDPLDPDWTASINPLAPVPGVPPERIALQLSDVVLKIWKLEHASAPRMTWLLTNTFLALAECGLTLLDLPRFLTDGDYQSGQIARIRNQAVREFFDHQYPVTPAGVRQWVGPALNKLGRLLLDPAIRLMLAGNQPLDFGRVLDEGLILLVNTPKGILGEGSSALLGAFIVSRLQQSAVARANRTKRPPFYLYLDEFQNYTTDNVVDILAESRKYALSLTLAHQYLNQLSDNIRHAVLNTSGNMVSFRVGYRDAVRLAKDIFPSFDYLETSSVNLRLSQRGLLPRVTTFKNSNKSGWEYLAQAIASLPNRHFWVRTRGSSRPRKQQSFNMPDPVMSSEVREQVEQLRETSGSRFGRLKGASTSREHDEHETTTYPVGGDLPLWGQ